MSDTPPGGAPPPREGNAAGRLAADTAELVRQEIARARADAIDVLRRAGMGAAFLTGAGACGVLAFHASSAAILRLLESFMPPRRAAFVFTGACLTGGGVLAYLGLERLRMAGVLSGRTLSEIRRDVSRATP